jgi:hypothetical protein
MARYIKRALVVGSTVLWVGFDFEGVEGDFSEEGYYRADEFTPDELRRLGVDNWILIPAEDGTPN